MILAIRTDQPEAVVSLFEDGEKVLCHSWMAHRELSNTLLSVIKNLLDEAGGDFDRVDGIVVFRGPGSFTGLRIGIATANALADGLNKPIVGETGDKWDLIGVERLKNSSNDKIVIPEYGADPHITVQKK